MEITRQMGCNKAFVILTEADLHIDNIGIILDKLEEYDIQSLSIPEGYPVPFKYEHIPVHRYKIIK